MTKEDPRHGLNRLAEVPDKRNPRGKRHPLSAILGLSVIAMMCGYRSYSAIAQWGRTAPPEFAKASGSRIRRHLVAQHSIIVSTI